MLQMEKQSLKLAKFQPVMKLSNFEPFTHNDGMDLHLQVKL